ncbi:Nitronate monooxygenase-domain-containing protein [Armillaria novae-zelandiae]|uniref:Nitronate monooxygenase-domain-containing protein n=1 Tax=Armillaria novae-zelandiae TaxID=153914 RepID=A0AA39P597_9AGAR|nr:Nitronate monooxygenase-domain-containing protein [Armillaria novae-zelandiae]
MHRHGRSVEDRFCTEATYLIPASEGGARCLYSLKIQNLVFQLHCEGAMYGVPVNKEPGMSARQATIRRSCKLHLIPRARKGMSALSVQCAFLPGRWHKCLEGTSNLWMGRAWKPPSVEGDAGLDNGVWWWTRCSISGTLNARRRLSKGFDTLEELVNTLRTIRRDLDVPPGATLPVGVGFISWILKLTESSDDPRLVRVLEELPKAVWFAFGDDLGDYIAQVRAYDRKRNFKTLVYVIVNSVEEALRATNEWKSHANYLLGIEAGGHGGAKAPPLLQLLSAVLAAVPEDGPLILAAGGIATGAQIASLLTLGACGVVVGTRFLFARESAYSSARKDALIKAGLNATARGLMFDEVGRTMGWPDGIDGRAIANGIWRDHDEGLGLDERLRRFDESSARGEPKRLVIWAGVGVGLTDKIQNAKEVVRELHQDALQALQRSSMLLV